MTFDLIVIGSGPAGMRAAIQAAKAGKRVAIIESFPLLGGGCVHYGTLPSKSFRESVYRYALSSRGMLGKEIEGSEDKGGAKTLPDIMRLWKRKERVIEGEAEVVKDKLTRNKVKIFKGKATFLSPHELEVTDEDSATRVFKGEKIFIAVGANPVPPKTIKVDGKYVLDSNSVLDLSVLPKTMAVLGAGIIGCEYGSMFMLAGTKVHLVDKRNEILASVDREIVSHLTNFFEDHGLEIILEADTESVKIVGDQVEVKLTNGRTLTVDRVLVAMGRRGNTEGLDLDKAGLTADDRGLLKVNAHYQTSVDHIYAVGDVIGAPALASTSMEQGRIASAHAFGIVDQQTMPTNFPYGIYTIPEISMIGETEESLTTAGRDFVVGRALYKEVARGQIVGDQWGMLKLIVCRNTLKLLGIHIIGDNAAEIIHIGQSVMHFGGDVNYFIHNVFNYPTLAEAYKTAAFNAIKNLGQAEEE
ncbi:MAG: Si-specific NAD(P)(+) transhydrogenase [Xanthomonadaceae bacterium]|nr:Si-specific NAD(P)(+) transhydrogenase [Xanthomonadaceae bacterium]